MEGKVFFSYQENGAAPDIRIHRKQVFFTYQQSSTITDTLTADTTRATAGAAGFNADTVRRPAVTVSAFADSSRIINAAGVLAADTSRILSGHYGLTADTRRLLAGVETFNADTIRTIVTETYADTLTADTLQIIHRTDTATTDTSRNIAGVYSVNSDTIRIISAADVLDADTVRTIKSTATFSDAFNADAIRRVIVANTVTADTIRSITAPDETTSDTGRIIHNNDTARADTIRNVHNTDGMAADTVRIIRNLDGLNADTSITIPYLMRALNPSEINISLEKGQLSETFEITTPVDVALESAIKGKLLDFAYNFRAYSSSGRGLMRTITGMYDIDKLLYTPFTYARRKDSSITAKDHAGIVAKLLDKSLDFYADDFHPSEAFTGINSATIQNIISGLFGWAGNLPQDWITVILRGDRLKVVQRGHEPNTIDITGTKHSRPQVDRRLMRSVWGGSVQGTHEAHPLNISPLGYTGTIRFGDSEVTYHFGLVTREVTTTAEGTTTTTYNYDYDDYLTRKVMETPDETITTDYTYAVTLNDKYLATETAVSVPKGGDDSSASTTITQHVYLGNGWYGTSVYVDGVFQSSNVSNGKPGAKANKYTIDQSNLNLGAGYPDSKNRSYEAAALFDTSFPISDAKTLKKLTRDIEWLDRKTEEKLTMDIWQYGHLIDFTDKIIYNGNTYYLESNQVQRTPTELKQTVSIIRWY